MRLSAAIVVLTAGAVTRAQLSNIPQCSLTCFTSALGSDGCSELTDFACHCQKPGLVAEIVPCINKACDVPDRQAVSSIVDGLGYPNHSEELQFHDHEQWNLVKLVELQDYDNDHFHGQWNLVNPPTSTTVGGGSSSQTSSPTNPGSPQGTPGTPEFNGASVIAPGAVQMVGSAILLASMVFFI
ncbi:Extracellular membrane protein CFEM domain [Penicillium cf. griseofulvum]|uniref:Extracellular membrane protein CFEM domain n=1 Tax=Penicillium cf. griseofulvum TaxID=2972120 RepID=A0A9W9MEF3_9EURO|nr:Extracellular membrane protein CFEM domain [Penicillium cf. griseofulvum]KAJ5450840.1 Extracellular membrane protein CFEM domain [Penicillium cf. griseofulvum]